MQLFPTYPTSGAINERFLILEDFVTDFFSNGVEINSENIPDFLQLVWFHIIIWLFKVAQTFF